MKPVEISETRGISSRFRRRFQEDRRIQAVFGRLRWKQEEVDGVMTWKQVRSHVTRSYDCSTGLHEAHDWPSEKKSYCCSHFGKACG